MVTAEEKARDLVLAWADAHHLGTAIAGESVTLVSAIAKSLREAREEERERIRQALGEYETEGGWLRANDVYALLMEDGHED